MLEATEVQFYKDFDNDRFLDFLVNCLNRLGVCAPHPFSLFQCQASSYSLENLVSKWHPDGSISEDLTYSVMAKYLPRIKMSNGKRSQTPSTHMVIFWGNREPTEFMGTDGRPIEVPKGSTAAFCPISVIHRMPVFCGLRVFGRSFLPGVLLGTFDLGEFCSPNGSRTVCRYNDDESLEDIEVFYRSQSYGGHQLPKQTPSGVDVNVHVEADPKTFDLYTERSYDA